MDKKSFENTLRAYARNTGTGKKLALTLSHASIELFAQHGQLAYAQAFYDKMDANFSRKPAFAAWMQAFSPCKIVNGKFAKDKSENAVAFDVATATTKAFWDYAPDVSVPQPITETDVVLILERAKKRLITARDKKDANGNATPMITEGAVALIPDLDEFIDKVKAEAGIIDESSEPAAEAEMSVDTSDPTEEEIETATEQALVPVATAAA